MSIADARALAPARTIDEIDAEYMQAIEDDDLDRPVELAAEKPERRTKADAIREAEEKALAVKAEHERIQSLVPWVVDPPDRAYNQKGKIDQWFDDTGAYPTHYRAYSREEWTQAIDLLATTVNGLVTTAPDYQRKTGLYVEEHGPNMLLLRSKTWDLLIEVPTKSSVKGKTFQLKSTKSNWDSPDEAADQFSELVALHVPDDQREVLLDICCQYMRNVRIRVNRAIWAQQHPDLAYLLEKNR